MFFAQVGFSGVLIYIIHGYHSLITQSAVVQNLKIVSVIISLIFRILYDE